MRMLEDILEPRGKRRHREGKGLVTVTQPWALRVGLDWLEMASDTVEGQAFSHHPKQVNPSSHPDPLLWAHYYSLCRWWHVGPRCGPRVEEQTG